MPSRTGNNRRAHHRVTPSINNLNILPDTGKMHNAHESNSTRTRHTTRKLRKTYKDINYRCMDIKSEEDESPPHKRIISAAERLRTPSYPRRRSQGIITRNRLQ